MPKSWEYYQQTDTGEGIPYPLYWLCGLAGATLYNAHPQILPLFDLALGNNLLAAIPFDQMKAMTVGKMFINLRQLSPRGGKVRLGIYQNFSDTNNKPGPLVLDAGEIMVDRGALGLK